VQKCIVLKFIINSYFESEYMFLLVWDTSFALLISSLLSHFLVVQKYLSMYHSNFMLFYGIVCPILDLCAVKWLKQ
jgi:predicted permease